MIENGECRMQKTDLPKLHRNFLECGGLTPLFFKFRISLFSIAPTLIESPPSPSESGVKPPHSKKFPIRKFGQFTHRRPQPETRKLDH